MCDPISAVVAGSAILGAGVSISQGAAARKAQREAQRKAEEAARLQRAEAQRAFNRQNQKAPDIAGLLKSNRDAAAGGIGSTTLTGAKGAQAGATTGGTNSLIGSNTVLGQ